MLSVRLQHGRNIDIRYFRRLSELGEKMEANTYEMSLEEARKRGLRSHPSDESNILSIIAKCHDGHQALLLNEEAKIQTSVKEWAEEFLAAFRYVIQIEADF